MMPSNPEVAFMVVVYTWEGTQRYLGQGKRQRCSRRGEGGSLTQCCFHLGHSRCVGANERAKDGLSGLMGTDGFQKSVIGSVVPTLGAVAISAALAALPIGCCCNLGCSRGVALELVSGQTMVCV